MMFSQSAQIALSDSTQIVLGIGQIIIFIGVIWKIAIDSARIKHDISNLKKAQNEADKLKKEKWESHKEEHEKHESEHEKHELEQKETHEEIKHSMNQYNVAIQELRFDLHTNNMQFKSVEAKLEGIQTSIVLLQSQYAKSQEHQNEVTKELISAIKSTDIERRKS